MGAARNLTIRVHVVDGNGATVFAGVDWYTLLSTGTSRAVRRGVASVQENWRHTKPRKLQDTMNDIKNGVISQMLVFRRAFVGAHLDHSNGMPWYFDDFVANVSTTPLAAPFFIVA